MDSEMCRMNVERESGRYSMGLLCVYFVVLGRHMRIIFLDLPSKAIYDN